MNFGLSVCHPFFSSSEGLILLGQSDLWEDYEIINIRVGLLTLSLRNNAILVDFIQTGIFRGFSLFIINLAGKQSHRDGREAVVGGGGEARSAMFCGVYKPKKRMCWARTDPLLIWSLMFARLWVRLTSVTIWSHYVCKVHRSADEPKTDRFIPLTDCASL